MRERRRGLGLIDVLISTAIIGIIASGSLLVYTSIIDTLNNSSFRSEAVAILNQEIEIIRNLPYDSVGTQNGIPSGVLLQEKSVSSTNGILFNVSTTVRSIDDAFDGTLGGNPNDTAPADYKLVELNISCSSCSRFKPFSITTTVAPKNLESASFNGSLFVTVLNSSGIGVSGATVQVINTSTTPTVNLTDTTNASGILQLVGVPTSTQNYRILVSKTNYSSDKTYKIGDPNNPNPLNPDATVAAQTLTITTLQIDRASTLNIKTSDKFCQPTANQNFSLVGGQIIGTNPDVFRFSTSSITNAQGSSIFSNMEWGTYTFTYNDSLNKKGSWPLSPFFISPSTTNDFRFILATTTPRALLVTAKNSINGLGIASATILLTKTGFSESKITGRDTINETSWSSGQYTTIDGINATSTPGSLLLASTPSSTYTTSTATLTSQTFDIGAATGAKLFAINWLPTTQPPQTGPNSIKFQIASNNDQTTWNYIGPNGTAETYYTTNGEAINNIHTANRYFRYKIYMSTNNENFTPQLDSITFDFTGQCVPPAQTTFDGLDTGTFDIQATAIGYQTATSTITIENNWQEAVIQLSP